MSTITEIDHDRRLRNVIDYRAASRRRDWPECRRIIAKHRAETEAARGPAVSEVRTLARTHGPAEGSEPA